MGEVESLLAMRSIVQCNSGEGLRTNDRPEPLTQPSPIRSRIYPTATNLGRPTRI